MIKLINAIERKLTYTTVQAILIILGLFATSLLFMWLCVSGNTRQLTCLFTAHVLGALYTWKYVRERLDTPMGALVAFLLAQNGFTAIYIPIHNTVCNLYHRCSKRKGDSK